MYLHINSGNGAVKLKPVGPASSSFIHSCLFAVIVTVSCHKSTLEMIVNLLFALTPQLKGVQHRNDITFFPLRVLTGDLKSIVI